MFENMKKTAALYSAIVFFVGLDRFFKVFAARGTQFNMLEEILKFNFKANYYMAFSLPLSGLWLNAVILLIVLLLIYYLAWAWQGERRAIAVSLFAIIMGAASNLFDRLKYGYVVDYLDLKYFTVFNLADMIIVMGMAALLFRINKKEAV